MPSERARQENGVLPLRKIVFTLVSPRVQEGHSGLDEDRLNRLIHNDPRQCTRELPNVMKYDHSTIVRHFHSMGKVKKSSAWVPHAIIQNHKIQRVVISASLFGRHRLAREQHRPFLSCIVTGDDKWCFMLI